MTVPANVTRFLFQIPSLPDTLRVVGFDIKAAVSDLFRCEVELACENNALALEKLVGKNGLLTLFDERHPHYFHGEILQIRQGESGHQFTLYTVTLVPKLAFLLYRSNLRIFQQKTVPEIIRQVLKEANIQGQDVSLDLRGQYPLREYCTQYGETDFHFISRLLEEEGLFYFFEHHADRHTLVICDHNGRFQPIAGARAVRYKERTGMVSDQESIYRLHARAAIRPGKVTLRDYFFEKSQLRLDKSAQAGPYQGLEQYHYRGDFNDPAQGERYARLQLEAHQAQRQSIEGESDCPRLWPGYRFTVKDHPRQDLNAEAILLSVRVQGRQPQSLGEGASSEGSRFSCEFGAMPASLPFRAPAITPPPRVEGTQTAFVTGPAGEEIYTDQFGRVKVQFHWDREGQYDEASSCWLRVSQGLAGNQWGAMVIPRIGQEVIVSFLEGNPDRPLVTGTLYNGTNALPYPLPTHKTRTAFKSISSPGGGGFNELRIEDKKGQEQIYLHSEKDLDLYTQNDWKEWVGNEQHTTVGNHMNQAVGADQHTTIKQNHHQKIGQNLSQNIGQAAQIKISGSYVEQAGQDIVLKAGMSLVIQAGVELTLKAGGGLVKLDPSGVTIKGPMVRINTGGAATPGRPAVITPPREPKPADQGDKPGSASAPAMPNTAPVASKVVSTQSVTGGQANPDEAVTRVAVASRDTSITREQIEALPDNVSLEMCDTQGNPIANTQYVVTDKNGKQYTGVTDANGVARIQGLPKGDCKVSFPDSEPWK
ncbi:MAG: type VI secretion system tip protein TssI/VgrG [Pseudomonadota bacterium]|nr:type VI secretion system tip protein TssI/VgrG [Pseudomonadota bacterium]